MKTRWFFLGLVVMAAVVALAAGGIGPVTGAAVHETRAENMKFVPDTLTITVGDTVRFVNKDDLMHAPISGKKGQGLYYVPTKDFYTGLIKESGGSAEVAFKTAGEHLYFCALHPFMQGKVVVK